MATFNDLLGRLGNEDINSWLQLHAWSQSVILTQPPSDVITPSVGVAMTTTRDVIAAVEKDNRFLSTISGERLDYTCNSSLSS